MLGVESVLMSAQSGLEWGGPVGGSCELRQINWHVVPCPQGACRWAALLTSCVLITGADAIYITHSMFTALPVRRARCCGATCRGGW